MQSYFFSEIFWIIPNIWYLGAVTNYTALCLDNYCYFFSPETYVYSETFFPRIYCLKCSSCVPRLFSLSAWLTFFF